MSMPDSKIISLIQGMSEQVSAQFNGVGIKSVAFVDPNIFRFTLNDASSTVSDVTVTDFNNYSVEDKAKVLKIISNGLGDLFLSNDGSYKKITMNNIINYNQPVIINSSDWVKIADDDYSLTLTHNLNNRNIIPIVYNNSDKVETLGIQRDLNKLILESTQPIDGMVVINYSTTDTNNSMNNIATIKTEYNFPTITDRDNYFTGTPIALKNGLVIAVGTSPTQLMSWNGVDAPTTYNNTQWSNQTGLIRGEKGDIGSQGIQGEKGIDGLDGKSAYDLAVSEQAFSGTVIEYLESINSCLGKFTSLSDLKIAYPSGIDHYKFAIISTVTGQVGIAFYNKTNSTWDVTVFASTNGSSVVRDDKSIGLDTLGNMEVFGFENASNNTIPSKNSSGEISYLGIEKNNTNTFTTIASKEYVDQSILGGLSIQNDYYDASSNTPNISLISTGSQSYAWIVLVGGTQNLGGQNITFDAFDLVIKTSGGSYLKIHNATTSWGSITGSDITLQTDLINKLNEYAKIDDTDITSATKTYSIKHILEKIDKHRKIYIQSDSPTDMVSGDIWIDNTSIPYSLSEYNSTSWVSVGSAGGTKINDWVSNTEYKQGEYVIHDNLLYKCSITNTDATFTASNWNLISGHIIKDSTTTYVKRSNLQFTGNVNITDDSTNDSTIINVSGNAPLWILSNTYKQYDLVTYTDGCIYQANADIPTNTTWAIGNSGTTWRITNKGYLQDHDMTKAYSQGDRAIFYGIEVEANADIPANNPLYWGTMGTTWKPILGSGYYWKGLYNNSDSYYAHSVVAYSNTSKFFYCAFGNFSGNDYNPTIGKYRDSWQILHLDNNIGGFEGATTIGNGQLGLVPAPILGQQNALLKGDGTWDNMDWTVYTPTLTCPGSTFHLVNSYTMKGLYRVVGKNLQLKFVYTHPSSTGFNEGTGTTIPYQISIPIGFIIDTTKANIPSNLASSTGNGAGKDALPLGNGIYFSSSAPFCSPCKIVPLSSSVLGVHLTASGTTVANTLWGGGQSYYGGTSVGLEFEANIPIT